MLHFDATQLTRPNTLDFKPPKPNQLLQFGFNTVLPFMLNTMFKGLAVKIDAASLANLKHIQGQRCLLLPNHPSEWDPCVVFEVARRLHENFYFVAAREVFDYSFGFRGWMFQRLGVYSLVRGSNDRASLKTSIEILAQNKGRLVIFVEGEISNQNESLLPLESGVVQLAFMALNELYKQHNKDISQIPPLYVCPTGLRYQYQSKGLSHAIHKALTQLEKAVGIPKKPENTPFFVRLSALSHTVLEGSAEQFGYTLSPEKLMGENVQGLSGFMLSKLEQVLNLPEEKALSNLDRIRRIRNSVDKIVGQVPKGERTLYQKKLIEHQKQVLKSFYEDLDRVVNFIAVYDGYLHPEMPTDRVVEMIRRLELEVLGKRLFVHPRDAFVTVKSPINLTEYFNQFLEDKKSTVEKVTKRIELDLYAGIQKSG